jgi:hypothetical protein
MDRRDGIDNHVDLVGRRRRLIRVARQNDVIVETFVSGSRT